MATAVAIGSMCALAGCSSGSPAASSPLTTSPSGSSGGTASEPVLHIAGVVAQSSDPYFISIKCGALAAAKTLGKVDLSWQGPTTASVAQEITTLGSVSVTKPSGVILAPFDPKAFLRPVSQLMAKGVPVALVDSFLSKNIALASTNTDVALSASVLASSIAGLMHDQGQLAIIAFGAGDPFEGPRYLNMVKVLRAKYPKIDVLPVQYASSDQNKAAQITAGLLAAHPNLSAIYGTDGPAGEGATAALRAAGKLGQVKVVAFDAEPLQINALRNGTIQALYSQAPYIEGYTAMTKLVTYLRAHPGSTSPVTPDNPYYTPSPQKFLTKANMTTPAAQKFFYKSSC